KEHTKVQEKGKRKHSTHFSIQFLEQQELPTKCAVVVPKKVYKKAVKRNHTKRKVFSLVKDIYPQVLPGIHLVVMLRANTDETPNESLRDELLANLPLAK